MSFLSGFFLMGSTLTGGLIFGAGILSDSWNMSFAARFFMFFSAAFFPLFLGVTQLMFLPVPFKV